SGSLILVIVAGLLVGVGTRIGNGCTSGHGICGIGRFSIRSVVATCTFMATAMLTVLLVS
ncbi:YeeE/YedE thiosulfate transporter family protein, partial [Escherichia coli]|nr:YeeE/YedE thiosulfate transporter family protein [Escherichia coli]